MLMDKMTNAELVLKDLLENKSRNHHYFKVDKMTNAERAVHLLQTIELSVFHLFKRITDNKHIKHIPTVINRSALKHYEVYDELVHLLKTVDPNDPDFDRLLTQIEQSYYPSIE